MTPERPAKIPRGPGTTNRSRLIPPPSSIIWAMGIAITGVILYISRGMVLILLIATGVAYLINPLVKRAESIAIKRSVAVTGLYLGIIFSLIVSAYFLAPRLRAEVTALSGGFPSFTKQLDETIDAVQAEVTAKYPAVSGVFPAREARYDKLNAFIKEQTEDLPGLVGHLATIVIAAAFIPIFSFFILRDSPKLIQSLMDRLPPAQIETSVAVWCEIDRVIGRYLRGLALDGLVIGTAAAVGLWMLGVNYPLLLGVFSGLANVVPYLGPILGGGLAMLTALMQFKSLTPIGNVLILYLCIKLLDDVVIQAATIGKSVHLHPMLLLASVTTVGHTFGVFGMILAVPAVTMLQEITKLMLERRRYRAGVWEPHPGRGVPVQPYVC